MHCERQTERLQVVGGDDLTLKVCFYFPENPVAEVFGDGDRIELTVTGDEPLTVPGEIVGKAGYFYLSGEQTRSLAAAARPYITYSVRILWADGEKSTPICGAPMTLISDEII
ncbi:MAG: hypothetical protein IJK23_04335 [Clostridia bacterium]|nr:hypothetical protein [Clostridia bacterium]